MFKGNDKRAARTKQRIADRQTVQELKERNANIKQEKKQAMQERRKKLASFSAVEKRTFIAEEKKARSEEKACKLREKRQAKSDYLALSTADKKAYRTEKRKTVRLEKRAKTYYVYWQVAKYAVLAALTIAIVYGGTIAYGAFVDNSFAFQNTKQVLQTPEQTVEPTPSEAETSTATAEPTQTEEPTPTVNPYDLLLSEADLSFMNDRVNILVLGIDESLERSDWSSFRTDTMILISIDFETNDVYMISLPRDSYVWIYNKNKRDKINSAFAAGGGKDKSGFEYAMNTVSMALGGVPVNHYICFDMNVVKEVVNAIGGLYYDVDVEVSMCGREIEIGYQYMDGQMVLDYCRQRKGDSDVARAERQQNMIFAIFEEIKNTGQMQDIPDIYSAITGNIYTDLSFNQIVSLAAFGMQIDTDDLNKYMLPGGFLNIDGISYWGIHQYQKKKMVQEIFGVDISYSAADDLDTLLVLAQEKRDAVSLAETTATDAEAYIAQNSDSITPEEMSEFETRTQSLRDVAAVKQPSDVAPTTEAIHNKLAEYSEWLNALKETVAQRQAATPTPEEPTPEEPTPEEPSAEAQSESTPSS